MSQITPEVIEQIVRSIVEQVNTKDVKPAFDKHVDPSGVAVVKTSTVKCKRFDTGKPGDQVYITDMLELNESEAPGYRHDGDARNHLRLDSGI